MSTLVIKKIQQAVEGSTPQILKIGGIAEDGSDSRLTIDENGMTQISFTNSAHMQYNATTKSIDFIFN